MNASDVIGFIVEDTYYCPTCCPTNDESAIVLFGDSETDSWSHCAVCSSLIPEQLTALGVEYHMGKIREFLVTRKGNSDVVRQWAEEFGAYQLYKREKAFCELAIEIAANEDVERAKKAGKA